MGWTKFKLNSKMEVALTVITSTLCTILLLKILNRLRSALPWRVNCWFCNSNTWVKYSEYNNWTCPKCEQYNGFTKDGDYNKTLIFTNEQVSNTPKVKVFQKSAPKNGLCKMCNINQQLKVTQLANFVPMNDKHFDEEIEAYRMQLEKAYKLCSPCRRVLQVKLHKEKETLLSTKLLENRSPEKRQQKENKQTRVLRDLINNTSMLISAILLILVSYEFYHKLMEYENLPTVNNFIEIVKGILNRLGSIMRMKIFTTFPSVESFCFKINSEKYIDMLPKSFNFRVNSFNNVNMTVQEVLGVAACLLQIVANIWNVNTLRYTIAIDLLWTVFVLNIAERIVALNPLLTIVIKMTSMLMLLLVYKNTKKPGRNTPKKQTSPIPIKRFPKSTMSALIDNDDAMALDSDDDVSLSKFGLHNLSESSNETMSPFSTSLMKGRTFSPRNHNDSLWTKPKLNSTFCVNSVMCKSPNSTAETVFAMPSFHKYQKLVKDDSDSDLDESISSLSLGGPTKSKNKTNSIFSLRKFNASPNFVTPIATSRGRPLISPSKLGHGASWVAGGYWGTESDRQIFNVDGSRSSSQSSGFESQTSSMNTRNVFSQPPSREESVCGEPPPVLLERFNLGAYNTSQNFSRMSSPVFPQMQYNGHVQIPQARFPQHNAQNLFYHQTQYIQNGMFKTPGTSGLNLIKLPQVNSFASH